MPPLSREFLLSRGKCCHNGCQNCPYPITEKKDVLQLPRLPDDCSRCHDKGCPNRNVCLRWLRRDDDGWQVVSAATFRKEDGSCDEIIRLDPGHETYVRRH